MGHAVVTVAATVAAAASARSVDRVLLSNTEGIVSRTRKKPLMFLEGE